MSPQKKKKQNDKIPKCPKCSKPMISVGKKNHQYFVEFYACKKCNLVYRYDFYQDKNGKKMPMNNGVFYCKYTAFLLKGGMCIEFFNGGGNFIWDFFRSIIYPLSTN